MKFIQSYWTKPIRNNEFKLNSNNILYKLSSFLIKKYFPEIQLQLVTDSFGVNALNTEYYDSIRLDFDHPFFDDIDETFWAAPKILALLKYKTPYIHIDGDFFIGDKIKINEIFNQDYDVIIQNKEIGYTFKEHYENQLKTFNDILKQKEAVTNYAYNCGVIGFKNQKALERYLTEFLFTFSLCQNSLKDLKSELHLFKHTDLNCLMEQHLLAQVCFMHNFSVKEIVPPIEFSINGWCTGIDPLDRFFHPMGKGKYSKKILDFLDNFFQKYKNANEKDIPNIAKIIRNDFSLIDDMDKKIYNDQLKIFNNFMLTKVNNWREDPRFPLDNP